MVYVQVDRRVPVADRADVALEVADVDGVEAYDGHEQTDVCLSKLIAHEVVLALEDFLKPVK